MEETPGFRLWAERVLSVKVKAASVQIAKSNPSLHA
jgi:hypothetical protein